MHLQLTFHDTVNHRLVARSVMKSSLLHLSCVSPALHFAVSIRGSSHWVQTTPSMDSTSSCYSFIFFLLRKGQVGIRIGKMATFQFCQLVLYHLFLFILKAGTVVESLCWYALCTNTGVSAVYDPSYNKAK